MSTITTETQRIPALLWESLQDTCYQHDQKFVADVSRILGIPAAEVKKKVLGTRGVLTNVTVEHGPWWTGLQCAMVERKESLWTRCGSYCDSGDTCMKHRHARHAWNLRRYDDPYFAEMTIRQPIQVDGVVYWVSDAGDACKYTGSCRTKYHS